MIRIIMLVSMCLFVSCFDDPGTGPAKRVCQTSGNYSITYDGDTYNYSVPEGAGFCRILGDSTMYHIEVNCSDSRENFEADKSRLVFWGFIKKSKIGILSSSSSSTDSTFVFGFYDSTGSCYRANKGTINFTTFPLQAGDTLKGTITGTMNSIIKYDPKSFSAQFSLTCESFN
jgi:hypothetical protein